MSEKAKAEREQIMLSKYEARRAAEAQEEAEAKKEHDKQVKKDFLQQRVSVGNPHLALMKKVGPLPPLFHYLGCFPWFFKPWGPLFSFSRWGSEISKLEGDMVSLAIISSCRFDAEFIKNDDILCIRPQIARPMHF